MARQHKITLTILADDAKPILWQAAFEAAKFGAWTDYFASHVGNLPSGMDRKTWQGRFLKAKRMVEVFGVEYEPTSEAETLTVDYPWEGGTREFVAGVGYVTSGQTQNLNLPYPSYRREVHTKACEAAADRVVRRWRASLELENSDATASRQD